MSVSLFDYLKKKANCLLAWGSAEALQGLPDICLAGEGVPCTQGRRGWWRAVAKSARAAGAPDPAQPLSRQGWAAAAGLHPGTAAKGTLAGTIPMDTAKLERGRRARIS